MNGKTKYERMMECNRQECKEFSSAIKELNEISAELCYRIKTLRIFAVMAIPVLILSPLMIAVGTDMPLSYALIIIIFALSLMLITTCYDGILSELEKERRRKSESIFGKDSDDDSR